MLFVIITSGKTRRECNEFVLNEEVKLFNEYFRWTSDHDCNYISAASVEITAGKDFFGY